MTRGCASTSAGVPLAMTAPCSRAIISSQIVDEQRHVVLDDEDRRAGGGLDPLEQRPERLGLLLGDATGWFVEHDHRRVRGEQARQLHDAARPGRELAGELATERAEPHQVDEDVDRELRLGLGVTRRRLAEGVGDDAAVRAVALAARAARSLRSSGSGRGGASWNDRPSPQRGSFVRRTIGDSWSSSRMRPAVDGQEARHAIEQRRLARAVLADEPEDLARRSSRSTLVDRGDAAEALGDTAARQHGRGVRRGGGVRSAAEAGRGAITFAAAG